MASNPDIELALIFFPNKERAPDFTTLPVELEILSQFCQCSICGRGVVGEGHHRQLRFKQANRLCELAPIAPVAVAAADRTFSKLNFLRIL